MATDVKVCGCGHSYSAHERGSGKCFAHLCECLHLLVIVPTPAPDLAAILTGAAQILDAAKLDWGESWSEWDQSIRDGITKLLKEHYENQ